MVAGDAGYDGDGDGDGDGADDCIKKRSQNVGQPFDVDSTDASALRGRIFFVFFVALLVLEEVVLCHTSVSLV